MSDWRSLPAATAAHLYRRERIRWRRRLAWETVTTWTTVETARAGWGLPGLVCHDREGCIRGWTFYMVRHGRIDVGGLVADDPLATSALIAALATEARAYAGLAGFLYAQAPGLEPALRAHGFAAEPYHYLVRTFDGPRRSLADADAKPADAASTRWPAPDLAAAAELFRSAYGDTGRVFAPRGHSDEWQEYVANLVAHGACGEFSPTLSRAITSDRETGALAIVTALSRSTVHLAQIAVHPSWRRRRLARSLIEDVMDGAAEEGFARMSLLVSHGNEPARALYRTLGFVERDAFLAIAGR